jgi:hypothetical protein
LGRLFELVLDGRRVIVLAGQQFEDLKGYLQETDLKTKAKGGEDVSTPYFAS